MAFIRNRLRAHVVRLLTLPAWRSLRRKVFELVQRLRGDGATIAYFHQADDPYSHLCAHLLGRITRDYRVEILAHLVPSPDDSAAPDRQRLALWSRRDALALARDCAVATPPAFGTPTADDLATAESALAAAIAAGRFVDQAAAISDALWAGDQRALAAHACAPGAAHAAKQEGAARRKRLGHYLGATFYYCGEWYWGVDRLHYLEQRLRAQGLCRDPAQAPIAPAREIALAPRRRADRAPAPAPCVLHFFFSFRSPYSYLALPRVRQLAAHYGARLELRFVLPMVMRGLAVPREKTLYILADAAREAQRAGMRFGYLVDPLGAPVERGYALLHRAMAAGRGLEMAQSFLQGVWADGIDAGTDSGLLRIAGRAGLDAAFVQAALADASWRALAEANRVALLAMDLWGVPSFRIDDRPGHWGQDRLWLLERDLIAAEAAHESRDNRGFHLP